MAAVATQCPGACLSTELKSFLSSDSKAHGPAGHQLLRKLLSICTGKCELGQQQSVALQEVERQDLRQPAAPSQLPHQRTLRPRRRLPQLDSPEQQQRQEDEQQQEQQQRQQQQQQPRRSLARCRRLLQEQQGAAPGQQQLGLECGPQGEGSPDTALCADLLSIIRRERGVVLALALHAMHIWAQGSPARTQACIRQGLIPLLVQVLAAVLCESPATPTGAYASSMAVILLRTLTRSGEEGMAAFVGSGSARGLLHLLPTLREDRALCLALYLLSDVTRRSAQALAQATEAGGVALVVSCLRHPLGESTKFAALLINRWCLLAPPMGAAFRSAGALACLLCVLRRQHSAMQQDGGPQVEATPNALLSEVSAYSLSALAILGQEEPTPIREMLVGCPANLAAVTRAMTDYERSFQGTGFPHALLSSLLEGPAGRTLVAQVLRHTQLLPAWLSLRQVGRDLVERAAQPDVLEALASLPADAQGEVVQSVSLLLPHSPAFFSFLAAPERLAALTRGAVAELLVASSPFSASSTAAGPGLPQPFTSSRGSALQQQAGQAAPSLHTPAPGPQALHGQQLLPEGEVLGADGGTSRPTTRSPAAKLESSGQDMEVDSSLPASQGSGDLGEGHLQRGVSIIPEALRLEAISQPEQQDGRQQQQQQQQQQHQVQMQAAPAAAPAPHGTSVSAGTAALTASNGPASAPFTAALRRLLAAWAGKMPGGVAAAFAVGGGRGTKHGRGPSEADESEAHRAKRTRFAFSREDINVRRYDSLPFLVGGREFHAVGFVLEAHSPLLHSLLRTLSSLGEALPIPCIAGFNPDRMYRLFGWAVEYCYTGEVDDLDAQGALDLWTLAEFLQIDGLQQECEATLCSGRGESGAQQAQWQAGAASADGGRLLAERYQLGLAYPSGRRLRLGVAREVLAHLAADAGGPRPGESSSSAAAAAPWRSVAADVAPLLAAHPWEMAADMAEALAAELQPAC